jgi:hypothetical protein
MSMTAQNMEQGLGQEKRLPVTLGGLGLVLLTFQTLGIL